MCACAGVSMFVWRGTDFRRKSFAPLCNMAFVGRIERSRNSSEPCRYGNNSKERDAEMEEDMRCLQKWTNILVGQSPRSLDDGFSF